MSSQGDSSATFAHLASYIGCCHRSFVRQGCYGCLRNGSCCTGNRGAPPTKRKCYTSGATKSGGGRCQGGAPSPLLQPQPLLYRPPPRSRVWGGDGLAALPSPRASPVPVLSATPASATSVKEAGLPLGTKSSAPLLPLLLGSLRAAARMVEQEAKMGLWGSPGVLPASPPTHT